MIIHMLIGALALGAFWFISSYVRKNDLHLSWWQWLLTSLEILYSVFVLEVIVGFLMEDAAQAALVMGLIVAIVAVIGGVLLWRFVFNVPKASTES